MPSLAEYYGGALRVDAEPGTRFMYTNHGFATLGQIVADVTGKPLDALPPRARLRAARHGAHRSRPVRAGAGAPRHRIRTALATAPGRSPTTRWCTAGGGGAYSTPRDMARYVAALLGGGANEHGSVLKPATLATHVRTPLPTRSPRTRHRPGVLPDRPRRAISRSSTTGSSRASTPRSSLAPDDGVGVMAFANGARRGMHWLAPEVAGLLRRLLGVPDAAIRTDVAAPPRDLGRPLRLVRVLRPPDRSGPVRVRRRRRGRRATRPADDPGPEPDTRAVPGICPAPRRRHDPYVFRIELPWFGIGTCRVVFSRAPGGATTAVHLDVAPHVVPEAARHRQPTTMDRRWTRRGRRGRHGGGAASAAPQHSLHASEQTVTQTLTPGRRPPGRPPKGEQDTHFHPAGAGPTGTWVWRWRSPSPSCTGLWAAWAMPRGPITSDRVVAGCSSVPAVGVLAGRACARGGRCSSRRRCSAVFELGSDRRRRAHCRPPQFRDDLRRARPAWAAVSPLVIMLVPMVLGAGAGAGLARRDRGWPARPRGTVAPGGAVGAAVRDRVVALGRVALGAC